MQATALRAPVTGHVRHRMEHQEFVERTSAGDMSWGVRGYTRAVFLVWRTRGLLYLAVAALFGLLPLLGFAVYSAWSSQYGALAWILPGMLAFYAGKPNLNLINSLPWLACGLAGLVASTWFGALSLFGGLLPCVTWFLSGALKGTVMQMMGERLRASKDSYDRLNVSGRLLLPGA
jgi:hypothetical protein